MGISSHIGPYMGIFPYWYFPSNMGNSIEFPYWSPVPILEWCCWSLSKCQTLFVVMTMTSDTSLWRHKKMRPLLLDKSNAKYLYVSFGYYSNIETISLLSWSGMSVEHFICSTSRAVWRYLPLSLASSACCSVVALQLHYNGTVLLILTLQ